MTLPSKPHFSWVNIAASMSLATDTAVSVGAISNIVNHKSGDPATWYNKENSTIVLTGSQSDAKVINSLSLQGYTFGADTSVQLELYSGESQAGTKMHDSGQIDLGVDLLWASQPNGFASQIGGFVDAGRQSINSSVSYGNTYDVDANSGFNNNFSHYFDAVIAKSYRLTIRIGENAFPFGSNTLQSLDWLWLGYSNALTVGHPSRIAFELIPASEQSRLGGKGIANTGAHRLESRRLSLSFDHLDNSDADALSHILDQAGKVKPMLVTVNPNSSGSEKVLQTFIARNDSENKIKQLHSFGNSANLVFVEA